MELTIPAGGLHAHAAFGEGFVTSDAGGGISLWSLDQLQVRAVSARVSPRPRMRWGGRGAGGGERVELRGSFMIRTD
eukprot:COSAG01_NODE_2764_length_7112_cov_593.144018_11_plen_77_part_00